MDEPTAPAVAVAGAAADAKLRLAAALSREEVIRRRRRRLMQLHSLYRAQLWALADELQAKHAEYWWHHGTSPAAVQPPLPARSMPGNGHAVPAGGTAALCPPNCGPPRPENGVGGSPVTPAAAAGRRAACSAANCGAKAMPLAPYCFDHILLDPKQQLYKPCAFVTKKSSTPDGKETCEKPVLRGVTPLRCSEHDPKSLKNIIKALRNAGIDVPLTSESVPKLSLLISEAVRQIQMKRKLALNGAKTAPSHKSLK